MALAPCAECGAQISTVAAACPQCGARPKKTKWWLWVPLGSVVALLLIWRAMWPAIEARAKEYDRKEVARCWASLDPKTQSPEVLSMASAFCQKLEDNFIRDYMHLPAMPRQ